MGFTTGCQQHFATADSKKKGGRAWPTTGHALDSINPPNSFARSAPHLGCTSGPCPHVRGLDAWISRSLRPRRTLSTRAWARLDRLHQLQEPSHLVHTCVGSTGTSLRRCVRSAPPCPHVRGLNRPRRHDGREHATLSTRAWAQRPGAPSNPESRHLVHTCVGST